MINISLKRVPTGYGVAVTRWRCISEACCLH